MRKLTLFIIISFFISASYANVQPANALDYLRNPSSVKRIHRIEHPPVATSEMKINLNVNAVATIPDNAFNPNDPETFNWQFDFMIYDSLGAYHIVSLYYVKEFTNNWAVYPYVDGVYIAKGEMIFNSNGIINSVKGLSNLVFSPATGATSPQVFAIKFDDSTQYVSRYRVRSFEQNGSPNTP